MSPNGLRVVIVDDESSVREVLRAQLVAAGHTVVDEGADAQAGVAFVALHEPDVLVLDHFLPGVPGVDVISALRSASPKTAVIVYTSSDAPTVRAEAMRLGAHAVIDKADGPVALLRALRDLA